MKKLVYVCFIVIMFLSLSGIGFSAPQSETAAVETQTTEGFPITVADGLGYEVFVGQKPQKILSATLMTDEILLSLVDKEHIAGVTAFAEDPAVSNVAPFVLDIPQKVVLNVELFITLEPDLIFVADWSKAEVIEQLRKAGLTVFSIKTPKNVTEIQQTIRVVGKLVGENEKAEAVVQWMDDKIAAVAEKVSTIPEDQRPSVMDYGTWGDAMGAGSTWDEIIRHAGLLNAVGDLIPTEWGTVPVSKEKLIELDPDILVLPGWVYNDPAGSDAFYNQIVTDAALAGLKAIKNESVYKMPENHKGTTSQYIVLGIEDLAKFAYPELFK